MLIVGVITAIVLLVVVSLETLAVQWLLGLFGWHFGFWTVMGMIFVVDFLCQTLFAAGASKR